jgi:hypothetical protein
MLSSWTLVTSICTARGCQLVYRSADGVAGLHITSAGRRPDRRRYFVWALPDSGPEWETETEARAAHAALAQQALSVTDAGGSVSTPPPH